MLVQDKKVAIIGGGPGGLTLAKLLQIKGINVTVYERDQHRNVRLQGATLDLHYATGLKALEAAGLIEAFKANYRPGNDRYRVVDKQANIFYDEHDKESMGDFGDAHFRPEIDRGPLRDILLDALKPGTVVWDCHTVALEKQAEGNWKISFQNGTSALADLVVGADGAHSKVRPFLTPIQSLYSGLTYLVGNIPDSEKNAPHLHRLTKGGKISAMGDSKTLFLSAKGDGSLDVYIGWKVDVRWAKDSGIDFRNKQQLLEWFQKEYAGWDPVWFELFACPEAEYVPRPLEFMPLDQAWEAQSNITLVGDAAHLLPPNGEGVNAAMLDALELSEHLSNGEFMDLPSAIAHYEKEMIKRFVIEGKETFEFVDAMYAADGLENMVAMMSQQ